MAFIRIQSSGESRGGTIPLGPVFLIGRDPAADLYLNAVDVSRRHCQITQAHDGVYWIEDLGSRNGTLVNGARQPRTRLRHGDVIRLGRNELQFQDDPVRATETRCRRLALGRDEDMGVSVTLNAAQLREGLALADPMATEQRLKVFLRVSRALTVRADEAQTIEEILRCLLDIFGQASRAYVLLGDSVDTLEEAGHLSRDPLHDENEGVRVSRTILNTVIGAREAVLSVDAATDDRFAQGQSIIQQNIRSLLCAPLLAENEVLGVIEVDSSDPTRPFAGDDLDLLVGVAGQIALFLRNVKLAQRVAEESARRLHLERFFSPAVARTVVEQRLSLGGELREGVVMFCDIVGFTAMSARLDPAELVRRLNLYLTLMVDQIRQVEGTIDKFGGDAILAVWGAPTAIERDARRALAAAIEMQNVMVRFNLGQAAAGGEPVGMGIGLHAGRFIAGNIGSEERMEYTVVGSDVNISQRVESTAAQGMIMASDEFCERVSERLLGCRFSAVHLKGAERPRPLVCLRGYWTGDEYSVTLPVIIGGKTPGKITRCSEDGLVLELVTEGAFLDGDAIDLEWDTPERQAPGFRATVTDVSLGMAHHWLIQSEAPGPYLAELLEHGVVPAGEGLQWRR